MDLHAAGGFALERLLGVDDLLGALQVEAALGGHAAHDSGPAHLAAAVGAPVVVLSGADDPGETSPQSPRKRLVYLDHLDCISCVKNVCPLKEGQHMQCMRNITVDMVLSSAADLLDPSAH